jgi:hypothetical protein
MGEYPADNGADGIAIGDLNGDFALDIATANFLANNISVLLNNGDGTFQPALFYGVGTSGPNAMAIGDFDNDGWNDLAVTNGTGASMSVMLSTCP